MRLAETAFLLLLAAFLVGTCLLGQFYYAYSAGLMLFPLLAAGFTLIVVVLHLVSLARARPLSETATAPLKDLAERQAGPTALRRLLWLSSVVPFVTLLGYPAGLAVYLLCLLRRADEGWSLSIGVAGGSLLVSYGLFVELLGVSLPLFPFWWPF